MIDYQGIAIVMGAAAAVIGSIGGFVIQLKTFNLNAQRDADLAVVSTRIDGLLEAKKEADTAIGFADGQESAIKLGLTESHDPPAPAKAPKKGAK